MAILQERKEEFSSLMGNMYMLDFSLQSQQGCNISEYNVASSKFC